MNNKAMAAIAVLLAGMMFLTPFMVSEDSDAAVNIEDVVDLKSYYSGTDITEIEIDSGETKSIEVIVWNTTAAPPMSEPQVIRVKLDQVTLIKDGSSEISYSVKSDESKALVSNVDDINNSYEFKVDVSVSPYSSGGTGVLSFTFAIVSGEDSSLGMLTYDVPLKINAGSSPGSAYNQLFTVVDMGSMNSGITALITLAVFLLLTFAICFFLYPKLVMRIGNRYDAVLAQNFLGISKKALLGLLLTFTLSQTIFINGGSLMVQNYAYQAAGALYIVFGALLIWSVYDLILNFYLSKKSIEDDSLIPLFIALGQIIIALGAVGMAMTSLGADWTYIITGMGIIGIVLGYGAQSTLTQFFSGLSILCTRPFKPGDLIRLDGSIDTLKVLDVGFMISKFENWNNAEVFTMPNDKVISSTIINVTKGNRAYRVFIYVGVAYGTEIKQAKDIMVDIAMAHPHVIKDGSYDLPSARLQEFADSAVTMRLAAYVDDFENSAIYAGQMRESIYDRFNEVGISIAFPQMDIHIVGESPAQLEGIITDKTIADGDQ